MISSSPGFVANRERISVALSEFTVPLLGRIYDAFDGDIVAAMVLGQIAHRNVESWLADYQNPEALLRDPERRKALMRPCNALSIAEACGLPRETVRRKVAALIKRGYIHRAGKGHLYLTRTVSSDFEGLTLQLVEDLIVTARRLEALLANQPTALGPLRPE